MAEQQISYTDGANYEPGGLVWAYAWDMMNGGFPFNTMQTAMREMGILPTYPPTAEGSRVEKLQELWLTAGLTAVETNQSTVEPTTTSKISGPQAHLLQVWLRNSKRWRSQMSRF
jgi:hypothetical protein